MKQQFMEKAVHEHVMQPVHEMNFSEINLQEYSKMRRQKCLTVKIFRFAIFKILHFFKIMQSF